MVENQIARRGVQDHDVLKAMNAVKRHLFIPDEKLHEAYGDYPISIGFKQTISQPYIVAYMTEALGLSGAMKVLEIGTGCGYQTAVLAEIVSRIFTIEVNESLSNRAKKTLLDMGYKNISFQTGDGKLGWEEEAPFDRILVTAAPVEVPEALIEQLAQDGKMIIPIGKDHQDLVLYTRTKKGFSSKKLISVRFVPLV